MAKCLIQIIDPEILEAIDREAQRRELPITTTTMAKILLREALKASGTVAAPAAGAARKPAPSFAPRRRRVFDPTGNLTGGT